MPPEDDHQNNSGQNVYLKRATINIIEQYLEPYFEGKKLRPVQRSEVIHEVIVDYCNKYGIAIGS